MSFKECMDILNNYDKILKINTEKIKGIKYPDEKLYRQIENFKYIKEPLENFLIIKYYIDQLQLNNENEIDKLKQIIIVLIQEIETNIKYVSGDGDIEFNIIKKNYNSQTDIDILKEYIKILKNILSKILENKGKVRTFIRLKGTTEDKIEYTINDEKTEITTICDGYGKKTFGSFKHIYDSITNDDLLKDDEVEDIINLLKNGVSSLLFSYGISGSGKSYTLFGKDKTIGIVQYIINNLISDGFIINIDSIIEEYVDNFAPTGDKLYKEEPLSGKIIKKESIPNELDINKLIKNIEDERIKEKRIKKTPNNKVSSRSHLYITFKIIKGEEIISFFTVIDCAGRETPKEIFDSYFSFETPGNYPGTFYLSDINNLNEKNTYVLKLKDKNKDKNELKKQLQKIKDIIKEGFYINESLNHLIYFINKQADIDNYKFDNTTLQKSITKDYDPSKYFYDPSQPNSIQTIKILNKIFAKKGSSGINPKIVMFSNVRLEKNRCIDTNKSLEFAQQVKSTV
jgi:hypothetical protein